METIIKTLNDFQETVEDCHQKLDSGDVKRLLRGIDRLYITSPIPEEIKKLVSHLESTKTSLEKLCITCQQMSGKLMDAMLLSKDAMILGLQTTATSPVNAGDATLRTPQGRSCGPSCIGPSDSGIGSTEWSQLYSDVLSELKSTLSQRAALSTASEHDENGEDPDDEPTGHSIEDNTKLIEPPSEDIANIDPPIDETTDAATGQSQPTYREQPFDQLCDNATSDNYCSPGDAHDNKTYKGKTLNGQLLENSQMGSLNVCRAESNCDCGTVEVDYSVRDPLADTRRRSPVQSGVVDDITEIANAVREDEGTSAASDPIGTWDFPHTKTLPVRDSFVFKNSIDPGDREFLESHSTMKTRPSRDKVDRATPPDGGVQLCGGGADGGQVEIIDNHFSQDQTDSEA